MELILHFIVSFILLIIVIGSMFLYFYFLYWLLVKILRKKDYVSLKSKKAKKLFLVFFAFNFIIYGTQVKEWITKDSAYLTAKAYYAVGNVVYSYRVFFSSTIAPDNPLIYPLVYPQKLVYAIGQTQLPDEDGEKAMWRYKWFLYPYVQRMTMPFRPWDLMGVREEGFLTQIIWDSIKAISEDNFKDKKIREELALTSLPAIATYIDEFSNRGTIKFTIFVSDEVEKQQIVYTKEALREKLIDRKVFLSKENNERKEFYKQLWDRGIKEHFIRKYISTVAYHTLKELESKWEASPFMQKLIKRKPKMESMRLIALANMIEFIFVNKMNDNTLTCNHSYVVDYVESINGFMETKDNSAYKKNAYSRYLYLHPFANENKYRG